MSGFIDIVCNIDTPEAVAHGWTGLDDDFKRQVRMRGQVSAIYLFGLNLAGIGLGPTIVASLTTLFGGDAMVSRAIATVVGLTAALSAVVLVAALRPYRRAMDGVA